MTDFGMARLGGQNPQATQLTFTMCPGTDVYMPPEAVKDKPVYTEKIDCFSFGVIAIYIVTRQFPKPGDRQVTLNDPRYPQDAVKLCVPEIKRRQNHISRIDPNHPLKRVALDCLKDRDVERPSAQQLCEKIAALKEGPQYSESVRVIEARSTVEQDRNDKRDREPSQQVQDLQQIIQSQTSQLAEKDQAISRKEQIIAQNSQILRETIAQKDEAIAELREQVQQLGKKERELTEKVEEIDRLERQVGRVNQQLEESERVIAELEQLRPATASDTSSSNEEQRISIKLTWREGEKAPCEMRGSNCAAVDDTALYVRLTATHRMFCYTISTSSWSQLPDSPTFSCPSVIINNLLTVVGGCSYTRIITNQLFSLTGEGSGRRWTEEFPPMPTKRYGTIGLCIEAAIIIAGGETKESKLQIVEVMNTETLQWSSAADLPQPLSLASSSVCGDQIYILGKSNMYTMSCSLQQSRVSFLASFRNRGVRVWRKVAAPPVTKTACVSIYGQLLAIGGRDSDGDPTSAVHMYNPTTDSWEIISHMRIPRYNCIAAVLPNSQLMVVAGHIIAHEKTDSVEFASIE